LFIAEPHLLYLVNKLSQPFYIGKDYTIWGVCYNQIIGATKNSDVKLLYQFLPTCNNHEFLSFGKCYVGSMNISNGTNSTNTTNSTSSNFVTYSLMMFAVIIMILLS